ncbi:hypothetical protein AN1V17_14430 [Vallitalea sediminicola]
MTKRQLFYIVIAISLLLLIFNVIVYSKTKGISSDFMSSIILIVLIEMASLWLKKGYWIYGRNLSVISVVLFALFLTISALYMPRYSYDSAKISLEKMNLTVLENDLDTSVTIPQINAFITRSYLFKVREGEVINHYIVNPMTGKKTKIIEIE